MILGCGTPETSELNQDQTTQRSFSYHTAEAVVTNAATLYGFPGPNGQIMTVSTDLNDYQEVDGILFPFSRKLVGAAPIPLDLKIKEIKVNSGVSDDVFAVE